jgi:hypothetical protein
MNSPAKPGDYSGEFNVRQFALKKKVDYGKKFFYETLPQNTPSCERG